MSLLHIQWTLFITTEFVPKDVAIIMNLPSERSESFVPVKLSL